MEFKNFLESQIQLPPIPSGYQRATRFTSPEAAQKIISGQDFNPGNQTLNTRMDIHADNTAVLNIIQSGKIGNFDRNSFGNSVLLADLTAEEWRAFSYGKADIVPNARFVGYVDLGRQQLISNHNYNPQSPINLIQQGMRHSNNAPLPPQPTASPSANQPDMW